MRCCLKFGCETALKNNYNLKITTTQIVDNDSFDMNFEMNASYIKINNTRYISYIESDNSLNIKLRTTIKVKDDGTVSIIKGNNTGMILENGKTHTCKYPTGYGIIVLDVFAHKIINSLNDNGGELELEYSLYVDGGELSHNTLHLTIMTA